MRAFISWLDLFCCQENMDNCYFLKKFFGTILTEDSEEQYFCKNENMYCCLLIYLSFFFQISVCGWLLTMISWGLVMVTLPFSLFVCFKVGHFYITILFLLIIPKIPCGVFFFGGSKFRSKVNKVIHRCFKGQLISKCLFAVFNSLEK